MLSSRTAFGVVFHCCLVETTVGCPSGNWFILTSYPLEQPSGLNKRASLLHFLTQRWLQSHHRTVALPAPRLSSIDLLENFNSFFPTPTSGVDVLPLLRSQALNAQNQTSNITLSGPGNVQAYQIAQTHLLMNILLISKFMTMMLNSSKLDLLRPHRITVIGCKPAVL